MTHHLDKGKNIQLKLAHRGECKVVWSKNLCPPSGIKKYRGNLKNEHPNIRLNMYQTFLCLFCPNRVKPFKYIRDFFSLSPEKMYVNKHFLSLPKSFWTN